MKARPIHHRPHQGSRESNPPRAIGVVLKTNLDDPAGFDIPAQADFDRWASAALDAGAEIGRDAALEVCVVVVDAEQSAALNRRHFDKNAPTNVLAFPCDAPTPGGEPKPLGDVVITAPVVEAEAREQGKQPVAHWAHLFVHAMLHLQGYDHVEDDEAERMEAREVAVLNRLGFSDPYQAEASGRSPDARPFNE